MLSAFWNIRQSRMGLILEFNRELQWLAESYMGGRWQSQDKQFDILISRTMIVYHILPLNFFFFVSEHDKHNEGITCPHLKFTTQVIFFT